MGSESSARVNPLAESDRFELRVTLALDSDPSFTFTSKRPGLRWDFP